LENHELAKFILPSGFTDFFYLEELKETDDGYELHLVEWNTIPEEYKEHRLSSKGFHEEITVQDFPLRGKPTYLKVKRRRWLNEDTGSVVSRDWNQVAKGTRLTQEFATFLKGIARYSTD